VAENFPREKKGRIKNFGNPPPVQIAENAFQKLRTDWNPRLQNF
jgi:hypothetical protein